MSDQLKLTMIEPRTEHTDAFKGLLPELCEGYLGVVGKIVGQTAVHDYDARIGAEQDIFEKLAKTLPEDTYNKAFDTFFASEEVGFPSPNDKVEVVESALTDFLKEQVRVVPDFQFEFRQYPQVILRSSKGSGPDCVFFQSQALDVIGDDVQRIIRVIPYKGEAPLIQMIPRVPMPDVVASMQVANNEFMRLNELPRDQVMEELDLDD